MSEEAKNKAIEHLIESIDNSNVRVTFGLQPNHINSIETEIKRWNELPPLHDGEKADPKYIKYVWEKLGKELGWCPFTLALHYFKYLEENKLQISKETF